MALYNPTNISVSASASSSSVTKTSVDSSSSSTVTLLSANSNRKGASFYNQSSASLHIDYVESISVSVNLFSVKIQPGGYFEIPFGYTGPVYGIWDATNGKCFVHEFV